MLTTQNWHKTDKQLSCHQVENINIVDIAEQNYVKELKKATYYVNKIKEMVNTGVKADLLRKDTQCKQDPGGFGKSC